MGVPIVRRSPMRPRAATENRRLFDRLGIVCVHVVGGCGAGKTSVLEAIIPRLQRELRIGVIEGDVGVSPDAERIAALGVPTVQALTDGLCHLSAHHVHHAATELPLHELDLLFVENVGSPTGPALDPLGEHLRLVVASIAAGDQFIVKYPALLRTAALVLLNKYDLLPNVTFDLEQALAGLNRTAPQAEVICTNARRAGGTDRAAGWLLGHVRARRMQRGRQLGDLVTTPS